jgi:hypothetical protein
MSNNQWVEIVAKLTLARSILATVILDIDNAVCDIDAGRLSLSKESANSNSHYENLAGITRYLYL